MLVALAFALAAPPDAERLPPPRERRLDADGHALPDGVLARLGTAARRHVGADHLSWSPDGSAILTGDRDGLSVWDALAGRRTDTRRLPDDPARSAVRYSADGRRFAARSGGDILVGFADTGRVAFRFPLRDAPGNGFVLAPNGLAVAARARDSDSADAGWTLTVRTRPDGAVVRPEANWAEEPMEITFDAAGRRLFVATPSAASTPAPASGCGRRRRSANGSRRRPTAGGCSSATTAGRRRSTRPPERRSIRTPCSPSASGRSTWRRRRTAGLVTSAAGPAASATRPQAPSGSSCRREPASGRGRRTGRPWPRSTRGRWKCGTPAPASRAGSTRGPRGTCRSSRESRGRSTAGRSSRPTATPPGTRPPAGGSPSPPSTKGRGWPT